MGSWVATSDSFCNPTCPLSLSSPIRRPTANQSIYGSIPLSAHCSLDNTSSNFNPPVHLFKMGDIMAYSFGTGASCAAPFMTHAHRVYLPCFHVGSSCIPRLSLPSKNPNTRRIYSAHDQHWKAVILTWSRLYIRCTPLSHTDCPKVGIIVRVHSQVYLVSSPFVIGARVIPLAISVVSDPSQHGSYSERYLVISDEVISSKSKF